MPENSRDALILWSRSLMVAALVAFALVTAGCSASLESLPLPSPGLGGTSYILTATFSNALNLPTEAKVKLNGADVGEVEATTAQNYTAVVRMRIRSGVRLAVGTTVELRTATPMGDVFVALIPPPDAGPDTATLGDHAMIGLPSTSAAATIEELLTKASLLVNGGAIENVTQLANHLGEELGQRGDRLADLINQTRQLVTDLAARSDQIRQTLSATAHLTGTLSAQQSTISDALQAAAPALAVLGENTQNIVDLVGRIDAITQQMARFPSIQGTNNASIVAEINQLSDDLNKAALNPNANLDALISTMPAIIKLTDASSAHADVDLAQFAVGALPDPNFRGDPGARLPDATDWTNFIGSLEYNLTRLRDKISLPRR